MVFFTKKYKIFNKFILIGYSYRSLLCKEAIIIELVPYIYKI